MATIIKSNVAYTGTNQLPNLADSLTALEAFTEYKNFVISKGGTIINETLCLADFQFMKDWNILGKVVAVSVNWGMKKDVSNNIESLFSPDKSEFIAEGGNAPVLRTDLFASPVIKFPSSSGGYFIQKDAKKNITTDKFIISYEFKQVGTQYSAMGITDGVIPNQTDIFIENAYNETLHSTYLVNADNSYIAAQLDCPILSGFTTFVNNINKTAKVHNASGLSAIKESLTMVNPKDAISSKVSIGKRLYSGSFHGFTNNNEFYESWLINDATDAMASALSVLVGSKF